MVRALARQRGCVSLPCGDRAGVPTTVSFAPVELAATPGKGARSFAAHPMVLHKAAVLCPSVRPRPPRDSAVKSVPVTVWVGTGLLARGAGGNSRAARRAWSVSEAGSTVSTAAPQVTPYRHRSHLPSEAGKLCAGNAKTCPPTSRRCRSPDGQGSSGPRTPSP